MQSGVMTTNPAGSQLSNRSLDGQAQIVQRAASAWCALAGFLVLVVGWGFGVSWVRTVLAGAPYVRVNAAIGLMVLGAALWPNRRWRRFAAMAGGLAALIGVLTVVEYAFGVNLRIDELAMRDNMPQVPGWPPGLSASRCWAPGWRCRPSAARSPPFNGWRSRSPAFRWGVCLATFTAFRMLTAWLAT
jgi:hypothetical protein